MKKAENILKTEGNNQQGIYLIYGEDEYLINEFIDKFIQKFDNNKNIYNITRLEDTDDNFLQELQRSITTISLIAQKKIIIVNCEKYFKSAQKDDGKLREILRKVNGEISLLITAGSKIDKRLALVKDIQDYGKLVNFSSPKYRQLDKWIENKFAEYGKNIDAKSIKLLEHLFNNQLQRLSSEIEKICTYKIDQKNIVYEDAKEIVSRERMLAEDVVFSFVDALCLRQKKKSLILLREMLIQGESPLRLLSNIVWQIKLLIQVKELKQKGRNVKESARILRQHPYPVGKAYKKCDNFAEKELEIILEEILQTNVNIISGEYSSPELAVEIMIHKII